MSETDVVIPELRISQKAIIDVKELYNMLKEWFEERKFDFFEKDYEDVLKTDKKDIKIKWGATKNVDEHNQFAINVGFKLIDHKIVEVKRENKKVKMSDCILEVKFDSSIERDYAEKWEGNILMKFFRGVYDKFVKGDVNEELKKELMDLTYEIFNETKAFLNLQRF